MSYQEIRTRIDAAARAAGRDPASVTLIAVSKIQPPERVRAALDAGARIFGENRVQEAETRWPPFRAEFEGIALHLVGPLQTNKLNRALALFDAIHSLDRDSLARKLAAAVQEAGACPELFVQVNTGREKQKAGVDPDEVDAFLDRCEGPYDLPVRGLMCIPPVDADPAPHFDMLAEIAARRGLTRLSMGMSDDFETAIACGATHVRIGSAIFGARTPIG